ncbi:MAG: methylenetetrahydrofolate reductase [NAD(P)H] [Oscillospiraceae bacterium]|nr:methylenetetrahydrofolate reductase [NAD(P)H] [Oscillospiraceae bacterium]
MKISEILRGKAVTVSCEVFPPKPGADQGQMEQVVSSLAGLSPDFISVTYGAAGKTRQNTLEVACMVQRCGVTPIAHLTCVSAGREKIREQLDSLAGAGVENILALRGDIPEGTEFPDPQHYRYAADLVREIREDGRFCIGGACYPEGHVESDSRERDMDHLKEKVEAGCEFLTSQMFFDNDIFYNFLYHILAREIRVPVIAGVMPVTNARQIRRITQISGTALPLRFRMILDRFGGDPASMKQAGIAYATDQIIDLIANGVRGVHIYTMNRPEIAASIMENLSSILGR